jgi:hypothetical protein
MMSEAAVSVWVPAEDGWNHIDGFASEEGSSDHDDDERSSVASLVSEDDQCEREVKRDSKFYRILQLCDTGTNLKISCMLQL